MAEEFSSEVETSRPRSPEILAKIRVLVTGPGPSLSLPLSSSSKPAIPLSAGLQIDPILHQVHEPLPGPMKLKVSASAYTPIFNSSSVSECQAETSNSVRYLDRCLDPPHFTRHSPYSDFHRLISAPGRCCLDSLTSHTCEKGLA